ncbi:hypothetical protein IFM89_007838 [Coptis chinensis]|uniref:Uncharacterized protein n=1 Tax=Coptis chinensis TaxID=261450 RepID=A0A835GVI0_9MAGN|nr:hypothetical protein IFM89_007838 [Coptis chinensis]
MKMRLGSVYRQGFRFYSIKLVTKRRNVDPRVLAHVTNVEIGKGSNGKPEVEEENSEKGLGIGNFVDVAYGMHEELVGDLSGGDGSQAEDVEPPIVLEPDLGKRYNEYKKKAEEKLYPSCEALSTTLSKNLWTSIT